MAFCFRVDIDSAYGMRNGVPNILELLRKLDMPASFFVVMGGETGALELLRSPRTNIPSPVVGVKLPAGEMARILLAPYNFAQRHVDTLKQALSDGHLVGCHGWKHREWTRSLNPFDVRDRFSKMTAKYVGLFGTTPIAFTAPGFHTNASVLSALDEFRFTVAGDLDGVAPFRPVVGEKNYSHVQVPVTLKDAQTRPLIEGLCFDGYNDNSVVKFITSEIARQEKENGFSCFYCHDVFEGITKLNLLKDILTFVKLEGIETVTMQEASRNCSVFKKVDLK